MSPRSFDPIPSSDLRGPSPQVGQAVETQVTGRLVIVFFLVLALSMGLLVGWTLGTIM